MFQHCLQRYITVIVNYCINLIYNLLFLPLALSRILYKAYIKPGNRIYLSRLAERLALVKQPSTDQSIDIWLHTVSVGEFIAAKPLLLNLIEKRANIRILITCTTPTGSELIQKFIQTKTQFTHYYYPYDNTFICRRFIKKISPKLAVFFETEIWPNMFKAIKRTPNCKLYIINARLSEKSYLNYKKIRFYISDILQNINYIAAQGENDSFRFQKLGVNRRNTSVYGNIKYNINLPKDLQTKSEYYKSLLCGSSDAFKHNRQILIAASTHLGEDEIVLDLYNNLLRDNTDLLLILAPRHPERFDQVYNLCQSKFKSLKVTRFSRLNNQAKDNCNNSNIFILDTLGELLYFYKIADLALIGGSMGKMLSDSKPKNLIGGHNPLEPAALGIPVVMGDDYSNFHEIITELLEHQAICIASCLQELEYKVTNLLSDSLKREIVANNAYNLFNKYRNVITKYSELLLNGYKY